MRRGTVARGATVCPGGGRYAGVRHGSNPGSAGLGGQRLPSQVPRVRGEEGGIPLRAHAALRGSGEVHEVLLRRMLYGISCRNGEAAAEAIPGAIGLSSSSVSRAFVQASAAELKAFQERDLSDGKSFAETTMVVALGVTLAWQNEFYTCQSYRACAS